MTLPTSRLREVLLQECLTWIGKYYEGGGIANACHVAAREVLNRPLDNRPLRRDMFILGEWERASHPVRGAARPHRRLRRGRPHRRRRTA